MTLDELKKEASNLQGKLCHTIAVDDAIVEIIEIGFEDTGSRVFCPAHSHTWFELNYVISGELITCFGEKKITFGSGTYLLVPPGVEHSHRYNNRMPHEGIFIRWQVKKSDCSLQASPESMYKSLYALRALEPECHRDDSRLFELLIQVFEESIRTNNNINLRLLFLRFLCSLSEIHNPVELANSHQDQSGYNALIKKINLMFNDVNPENMTAKSIAAQLHISYGHLARTYKKLTGDTLIKKLNSVKLEKALELLKNFNISINEISEISGFSSQYYFSRLFKEKYGVSPGIYRKMILKQPE